MKDTKIIKCPKCGREYLAGEIFYPKAFLGQPTDIIRSEDDKVEFWQGDDMDLTERYICDECNTTFIVEADVSFKTKIDERFDFSEDYSTEVYKDRLTLKE